MTPQEVASHAFAKAALGGYNMSMVDEFLDLLTEDYTALFNENAILKNKLKVVSDTVEEYRATDKAMRKTLLAAQQTAEAMVKDAEKQKEALLKEAESTAQTRINELRAEIAAEEKRLRLAKEATAVYARQVKEAHAGALSYLDRLDELTVDVELPEPVPAPAEEAEEPDDSQVIPLDDETEEDAAEAPDQEPEEDDPYTVDPDATRRFEDLQFGRNYEIT